MLLPPELRFLIYDKFILQDCTLDIMSLDSQPEYLKEHLPFQALSASCKELQSEIKGFLKKCRPDMISSTLIGYFIPETTTFLLRLSAELYSSYQYDKRYKDFIYDRSLRKEVRKVMLVLEDEVIEVAKLGMVRPWRMEDQIQPLTQPWIHENASLIDFRKVNNLRMRRVAYLQGLQSIDVLVRWAIERLYCGKETLDTSLTRVFDELCEHVYRHCRERSKPPVPRVRIFDERAGRTDAQYGIEELADFKPIQVEVIHSSCL